MCGIVAAVSNTGSVAPGAMAEATRCLRHRGPDAPEGLDVAATAAPALGHARLSIIDLDDRRPADRERGRDGSTSSPTASSTTSSASARELEQRGHAFRTRSDSEIALHLFEDRGARALHSAARRVRVRDLGRARRLLFAARDRFGIKPLYYTVHDGTFYLASEVKALAALGVPLRWDRDTLYDVHFVSHPPDRTLFDGIYQLPPGELPADRRRAGLASSRTGTGTIRRDDDDRSRRRPRRARGARSRDVFEEAVRLRLRADVPVALLPERRHRLVRRARRSRRGSRRGRSARTRCRSITPTTTRARSPRSRRQLSGAEFCRIDDPRRATWRDHFSDAICHAERPFANAHAVAKYLLSRAVRDSGSRSS